MKKLLFILLCCSIFVIGCNNVSEEEFDEFDFDEIDEINDSGSQNNEIDMNKINELQNLFEEQLKENKFDEAKATIDEAIKIAPEAYFLLCSRGKLKQFTGDLDGAEADVNLAISNGADNWMYAQLGGIKEAKGNKEEAISLYKKAIELGCDFNWVKESLSKLQENK